jgi:hypothetical protein
MGAFKYIKALLIIFLVVVLSGSCDQIYYHDGSNHISLHGAKLQSVYLPNCSLESVFMEQATGKAVLQNATSLYLQNGDTVLSFSKDNVTTSDMKIDIRNAELVDLSTKTSKLSSEVYCIGSWNVSQNVETIRTNQTMEI